MLKKRRGIYYFKKTVNGRTTEKSLRTTNRNLAERLAGKWIDDLYTGQQGWDQSTTFKEWWGRFEQTYLPSMSKSAQNGFRRAVRQVAKLWNHRPLSKITPQECAAYVPRRLAEGAKPSTIGLERQLLRALFNRAVEEGVLIKTPWIAKQPLKVQPRERVLTQAEQDKLFALLPTDFANVIQFFLWTGLRIHELLKAQPIHIIHVPVTGLKVKGKGGKTRVVPMDSEVLALAEKILPVGRVQSSMLQRLQAWAKKADIPPLTLHDLRRTFGTRCAEAGMPMAILSEIMGHSNIIITAKYYIHVSSESTASALKKALRGGGSMGEQVEKQAKNGTKM